MPIAFDQRSICLANINKVDAKRGICGELWSGFNTICREYFRLFGGRFFGSRFFSCGGLCGLIRRAGGSFCIIGRLLCGAMWDI